MTKHGVKSSPVNRGSELFSISKDDTSKYIQLPSSCFSPITCILCAPELSNSTLLKNVIHFNMRREKLQTNSANFAFNRPLNALQYTGYLYQNNVSATAVQNGTSTRPQNDADQVYAFGYKLLFNCIADGGDGSWQWIYSHF
uniref:Uncharacterized protein n=1 Tax=Echinococcus canadensis TaxID=519352 RepID=A0A915EXS0_9CEST